MTQVIINLVSNSIKYTPDGEKIVIWAGKNEKNIEISIADNGYGIPVWAREKSLKNSSRPTVSCPRRLAAAGWD